jgi:hypothetical protein
MAIFDVDDVSVIFEVDGVEVVPDVDFGFVGSGGIKLSLHLYSSLLLISSTENTFKAA